MSGGSYGIFLERPIAVVMLVLGLVMLLVSLKPLLFKSTARDWRSRAGLDDVS